MHPTQNSLFETFRAPSVDARDARLMSAIDLRRRVAPAYRNLGERCVLALRALVQKAALRPEDPVDVIAERPRVRDGVTHGAAQPAVEHSFMAPVPPDVAEAQQHMVAVSETLAAFGQSLGAAINSATALDNADASTAITPEIEPHLAVGSSPELSDRIEIWVNEGGAGGDVDR